VESLRNVGGDAVVAERDEVEVTAVRPAEDPRYSSPAASR
jgi:hypothetical protein